MHDEKNELWGISIPKGSKHESSRCFTSSEPILKELHAKLRSIEWFQDEADRNH